MFDLNDGEFLTETVREFRLIRRDGAIVIVVDKALVGKHQEEYSAFPKPCIGIPNPGLVGLGKSSDEALKDCLSKIKPLSICEIISVDN